MNGVSGILMLPPDAYSGVFVGHVLKDADTTVEIQISTVACP